MKNHMYAFVRVTLAALLIAGMFGVNPVHAETIDFGWAQRMGGANFDYETAIAVDDGGNVYTTGFMIRSSGNHDAFIHKWNATGSYLWVYGLAGLSDEINHAIALDGEGNMYAAGAYSGTVEFDPGNTAGTLTSAGLTDIFIIKYDGDGNVLWVKGMGGTSSDGGYGMTIDGSGNVYVTGIYVDTVDFDPSEGVSHLTSAGFADVFFLKLDGDGNFIWAKSIGGPAQEKQL